MNRSFRAQESQMQMQAAVMKQRQQLRASMMKEKEEELSLFLDMKKREKEQQHNLLLNSTEDLEAPLGSKSGTSPIFNISTSTHARKTVTDDFLNSDNDKNDYDWLLTPPGTPLFPSLEMESQRTLMNQIGTPNVRPTALKSRLANPQLEPASTMVSKQQTPSPGMIPVVGTRRPSSSGGTGSRPSTPTGRPATPTGRSTLTSTSKPSRSSTPTSRATLSSSRASASITKPGASATKPTLSATKSTVSATKAAVSGAKPVTSVAKPSVPARSSTPTRSTVRSSTPTTRPTVPPPKSTSRAATPTRRPCTPSRTPATALPVKSSPSTTKPAPATVKNPVPSRGTSPTVRSRPWKPSEMPGYSLDAPPNLRTSLPDRPLPSSRGRPGPPSSRSSSVEPTPSGRARRQSCSPSRGRAPNSSTVHASGSSVPVAAMSRLHAKANDNVSPVVIGTKMVERVINMRKLAPPKHNDKHSPHSNLSGKSSSPDSSGFGRSFSKKSLDMAIRHMDIRRTIPSNLRPLMTNIPASSMYSVRSGPTRSNRTVSVSDSPLATSSNASSEMSVNNNGLCTDGIELEDEIDSERVGRSPLRGR